MSEEVIDGYFVRGIERQYCRERAGWTDEQWAAHDAEIEAQRQAALAAQERESRKAHRHRLSKDGWPRRAIDEAQEADTNHPAIKRITEWSAEVESNIIVLSGVPGAGKTVAAAYWALHIRYGYPTLFVRASTFARSSRFDSDTRDTWLNAQALVLDDIGAEYADSKGSLQTDLDELVDTYYGDKRPLIITTNLTAAQFKARYGERITDRLRECGTWFGVAGTSLRGEATKKGKA